MIKSEKITGCPECDSNDLIRDYEARELVCEGCGMVVSSEFFSYGPEWRAFNLEQREKRTRVGAPLTWAIHDRGLSTIIDWTGRDIYGRGLKPEQRAQAYRLRKWNRRSKVSGGQREEPRIRPIGTYQDCIQAQPPQKRPRDSLGDIPTGSQEAAHKRPFYPRSVRRIDLHGLSPM